MLVMKKIGLPLRGRPILLSLVRLPTELDSTQSFYHYLLREILNKFFNNEEMPQSNDRVHPWKQRFGKKFWWKTSTKSCKKSCKVMQFYWSERIRTPLLLDSSVRQNFDPTFVATLQGSSLSAGRFQKGKVQESSWTSSSIFTKFNGTPCIWAVMGNVKKKKKKKKRGTGEFEWAV